MKLRTIRYKGWEISQHLRWSMSRIEDNLPKSGGLVSRGVPNIAAAKRIISHITECEKKNGYCNHEFGISGVISGTKYI